MTHQFRRRQRRMYHYMQLSVLISKRLVSQASPAKGVGFQPISKLDQKADTIGSVRHNGQNGIHVKLCCFASEMAQNWSQKQSHSP